MKHLYLNLIVLLIAILSLGNVYSQSPQDNVFVCVEPANSSNPPYIISFQNTQSFGTVILEEATVTVYGDTELSAILHSISFDANSGGYRLDERIALALSSDIINNQVCEELLDESDIQFTLSNTISLPTSTEYLLSVDTNAPNNFVSPDIRGVFSFHFQQATPRFQIIQQGAGSIEVSFPFLVNPVAANNSFIVISNKDSLIIEESFPAPQNYGNPQLAIQRDPFVTLLQAQGEDLYEIMDADNVCIYPDSGQILGYPPGKFLRLSALAPEPDRNFTIGDAITALDGGEFEYYVVGDPEVGGVLERATIRDIDNGNLIVGVEGGPDLVVSEPCLVDTVVDPTE